jgi:AcrR family transcriptional regulator
VVDAVVKATYEELAEVGYGGLSIEAVASRAGVNKTTVYRRWPTKADLVTEAILSFARHRAAPMPNRGSLRADLIELGRLTLAFARSVEGRAFLRLFFFEGRISDLSHLEDFFRARRETSGPKIVFERALERGELPKGTRYESALEMLTGTLYCKNFMPGSSVDDAYIAEVVDTILLGIRTKKGVRRLR